MYHMLLLNDQTHVCRNIITFNEIVVIIVQIEEQLSRLRKFITYC